MSWYRAEQDGGGTEHGECGYGAAEHAGSPSRQRLAN
jgi:hypothetical protein